MNDERQKQLVEALKHAVQSQTARARLSSKSTAEFIAPLSPCILTSNSPPPEDPAFQRRIIPIHFSREDEPTAEERQAFTIFLNDNIDKLGTLGDFAANYILKNKEIIKKDDWKEMAIEILTEFYKAAGKQVPTWINDFVEEHQVQDIAEDSTDREHLNTDFESRLVFCLDKDLIPFLKRKSTGEVLITHDIVKEMKAQRINHISNLSELGRILQSEVKPSKLGGRTTRLVTISIQKFIEFVRPSIL